MACRPAGRAHDSELQARLPPHAVTLVLGLYSAARSGEFADVGPTLARPLARPPATMRTLIAKAIGHEEVES